VLGPARMETAKNLGAELDHALAQLKYLSHEAERNLEILRRSQRRELDLLSAGSLPALLETMTRGLAASYGVDSISVIIADPEHSVRQLLLAAGASVEHLEGLRFVGSMAGMAPQYAALHEPWLGKYSVSDHQLVFPTPGAIASVAMIPLRQREKLFGSINLGSSEISRFTAQHATDFFAHLGVIASFSLENVVNRERLYRSGFTDVLTGWHNRRYLQIRMAEELASAQRYRRAMSCLILDVDHFKRINDQHGHAAGDEVLREIAQRVESQIRASDIAARYGGEEFVVLLPDTKAALALQLGERIIKSVADGAISLRDGNTVDVTASVGIASAAPTRENRDLKVIGESLLARADVALYQAKSAGRNRVAVDDCGDGL